MKLIEVEAITSGKLDGEQAFTINSIAANPEQAEANQLAIVFSSQASQVIKSLERSQSKAFILHKDIATNANCLQVIQGKSPINIIWVSRPKFALSKLMPYFTPTRWQPQSIADTAILKENVELEPNVSIGDLSFVGPNSKIGSGTVIHPRVSIGANCQIGKNCTIKSGVVIEDYVQIGSNVIIHPNAVIGADGYSYTTEEASNLEKLQKGDFNFNMDRQIQYKLLCAGSVIIEDDVEIGANTCIDRGNIKSTIIKTGTKIDNLCQIAHNVEIGKDVLIIAQTGIAGGAVVGDRVTMAGASGCGDGVKIGNDAVIGAFSAANSDVDPFLPVLGAPAIPYGEFLKRQRAIARLPKQQEEIRKLKSEIERLSKESNC